MEEIERLDEEILLVFDIPGERLDKTILTDRGIELIASHISLGIGLDTFARQVDRLGDVHRLLNLVLGEIKEILWERHDVTPLLGRGWTIAY